MKYFIELIKVSIKITLILVLVGILVGFFADGTLTWANVKKAALYNTYYGIPLCLVNGLLHDYLNKSVAWEKNAKLRAWLGFFGSILVTMSCVIILNYILWVHIFGNEPSVLFSKENRMFYVIALFITATISSSLHAIGFFQEIEKEKIKSEKLKKEILSSELNALKAHVDPHFLFNSFNTLSGLIDEDPDKAQEFLKGLSNIYRYILENRNEETNSVESEIKFAQSYLELQKTRFEDSIFLNINLSPEVKSKEIASLSLQLLLENAVKHNAFSEAEPLHIQIQEENDFLVVKNNKKQRTNLHAGNGMGLQNIKDRYGLLGKKNVHIENNQDFFEVKLPLL